MNLKRKLFMCNAHIKFNQICQKENLVPKYAQINRRIYNNNNAAIKTKTDAQKMRIKNEIKLQYKKKNLINSELLKTFLHNANRRPKNEDQKRDKTTIQKEKSNKFGAIKNLPTQCKHMGQNMGPHRTKHTQKTTA
jgi:Tfp pilus assembly protein PilE